MVSSCYPMCRAFRKRLVESSANKNQSRLQTIENSGEQFVPVTEIPGKGWLAKISCNNCSFVYYGQNERSLKTRITEHKRAVSMSCQPWLQDLPPCPRNQPRMDFWSVRVVVGLEANFDQRLSLDANIESAIWKWSHRHPRSALFVQRLDNAIHLINHYLAIYPVDSVMQPLINWGQKSRSPPFLNFQRNFAQRALDGLSAFWPTLTNIWAEEGPSSCWNFLNEALKIAIVKPFSYKSLLSFKL